MGTHRILLVLKLVTLSTVPVKRKSDDVSLTIAGLEFVKTHQATPSVIERRRRIAAFSPRATLK
jgi:hypothetical protein